jgi:hypothetical protein
LATVHDQETLEVDHTQAFGFHVFPYAGVFLHPSAHAGAAAAELFPSYRALGFDPGTAGPGVDHLSTILLALGHASLAEARLDPASSERQSIENGARDLIDRHVLSWLPVWVGAVGRLGRVWPTALANQILDLVSLHRASLGTGSRVVLSLEPLPDLDASETDLRVIAEALTTPVIAGIFLSRHDISALARARRAPSGFGSRADMLENTLRSAASYGMFAELSKDLRVLYEVSCDALTTTGCAEDVAPWKRRGGQAIALLERLGAAALNAVA